MSVKCREDQTRCPALVEGVEVQTRSTLCQEIAALGDEQGDAQVELVGGTFEVVLLIRRLPPSRCCPLTT